MKHTLQNYRAGYQSVWDKMKVTNRKAAGYEAKRILDNQGRYRIIERDTGVPWFCVGIIHTREAGPQDVGRFLCCLHNGEKIIGTGRKTLLVPKGKGPFATFEDAAVDALLGYKGSVWDVPMLAYTLEKFNGFGYRNKGIVSPYLWGGTSAQERGKYTSDGVYDSSVMDPQIGGMAILKELMSLDPSIVFGVPLQPPTAPPNVKAPGSEPLDTQEEEHPEPQASVEQKKAAVEKAKGLLTKQKGWLAGLAAGVGSFWTDYWPYVVIPLLVVGAGLLLYRLYKHRKGTTSPTP